jgi:hypothetical protein
MGNRRLLVIAGSALVLGLVGVGGVLAASAAHHPDSRTQSIADGCNRSNLGLLGEAAVNLLDLHHPTPFPSWVYVNGDPRPRSVEGTAVASHTSGDDLFGVHRTHDLNVDIAPVGGDSPLLSSRNAMETPPQIHTEWETGAVPTWAWPTTGDHVRESGSWIWDCGHWQGAARKIPQSDNIPGDPLGDAGVETIGGEEAEIHPIRELATWRRQAAFTPTASSHPVVASQLDVYISNQGAKAKAVEECALLSPAHEAAAAVRLAAGDGCSELQDVTTDNYRYVLHAPGPPPHAGSRLVVQQDIHASHHAPAPIVTVQGDEVNITVPFKRMHPAQDLQDFGATWHAWWSDDARAVTRLRVTLRQFTIFNNLDGDHGEQQKNPSDGDPAEWNLYVEASNTWINLHDPRPGHVDYVPELGAVPGRAQRKPFDLSPVPPFEVDVPADGTFRFFVDARQCDQPGFLDCPADDVDNPLHPGRSEIVLPVAKLAGKVSEVRLHPIVCPTSDGCSQENSDPSLCPPVGGPGCHEIDFTVEDLAAGTATRQVIAGDGTAAHTAIDGVAAARMNWWLGPVTRPAVDQEEETVAIDRVVAQFKARGY